ncbi:DUF7935 family protein [Pedobacter sp.]
MDLSKYFLYASSLTTAGVIVAIVVYYMFGKQLQTVKQSDSERPMLDDNTPLLQLRLQAHERMIIFVDRINPANLLLRLHQQGIEIGALQLMAVNEIKTEFQHNITQQLYLEAATWNVIRKLKDDTIAMVNNAVKNLPTDASGVELSKKVLHYMSEIDENPYELTMGLIKQDIQKLF